MRLPGPQGLSFGVRDVSIRPDFFYTFRAESHIHGDPRSACFHARFSLEAALHWL